MINYSSHIRSFGIKWNIKIEPVYRLLDNDDYINNFFEKGEIMLSCFNNFKKNPDEMQGDKEEGQAIVGEFGNGPRNSHVIYESGLNAFVMSTTSKINDTIIFVVADHGHLEAENIFLENYQDFLNFSKLQLVEYDRGFLDMSWIWLNDKQLKYLTMTPEFSREEQQAFFKNLPKRKDYFIKGVTYKEIPIGACGLKNIAGDQAELWLYIGDKEYWGKGLGEKIMLLLEREAVNLNVRKIYLKVLEENKAAIGLYKKLSYIDAKFNGNHILMEKIL